MRTALHILHLEDSPDDGELIARMLKKQGIDCEIERVETGGEFEERLASPEVDLILSDFSLPTFDGLSALALAREKRPDLPFVFVSATLGEEVAINALNSGATDYVLKQRLPRLGPAVSRAIMVTEERRALQRAEEAMIQSEAKYRQLFECLGEAALLADARSGRIVDTNRQAEILLERTRAEILGHNVERLLSPGTWEEYRRLLVAPEASGTRALFEGQVVPRPERVIPVIVSAVPLQLHGRRLVLGLYRDLTEQKEAAEEIRRLKAQLADSHAAGALHHV